MERAYVAYQIGNFKVTEPYVLAISRDADNLPLLFPIRPPTHFHPGSTIHLNVFDNLIYK